TLFEIPGYCSRTSLLTDGLVHVEQDVGDDRPRGQFRRTGDVLFRAKHFESGLMIALVDGELLLVKRKHAIELALKGPPRHAQAESVGGAFVVCAAAFGQHAL